MVEYDVGTSLNCACTGGLFGHTKHIHRRASERAASKLRAAGRSLTAPFEAAPLVVCTHCSHAIVSSSVGPEYYVSILSFVDKTQLEPGCTVLMHNKVRFTTPPWLEGIVYQP